MSLTAAARMGAALACREADRVPFFLPVTLHPARRLGMTPEAYFHDPRAVVAGQLEMLDFLGHDGVTSFLHVSAEVEAFGGESRFVADGPPNAGAPPFAHAAQLERLAAPDPLAAPALARSLAVARELNTRLGGRVPVLSGLTGPLSLPVLQLGFERYLDLLMDAPELIHRLWRVNEAFCIAWGNAQLAAGVAALLVFEPLASPALMPLERIRAHGLPALRRVREGIRGATILTTASAPVGAALPTFLDLGFAGAAVSSADSLADAKALCGGRSALLGGLDGLAMAHWTPAEADRSVRAALAAAGPGGGFILTEHYGEIPWTVPDATLQLVAEAARRWGARP